MGKDSYCGNTKLKQISERVDRENPGFKYDLGTTLKSRDYSLASSGRPDVSRERGRAIVTSHSSKRRAQHRPLLASIEP